MKLCSIVLLVSMINTALAGEIPRAEVERIVSHLADDAMKGRRAATEGAREAASFIAAEFEEIGLKPFEGKSFLQTFPYKRARPESTRLTLNGTVLSEEDVVIDFQGKTYRHDGTDGLHVLVDDEATNVFGAMRGLRDSPDLVVILTPAEDPRLFEGLKRRNSERLFTGEPGEKPGWIMIRTRETEIREFSLEHRNQIETIAMANVVGVLPGKSRPDEHVVFSAHFDHLGTTSPDENGDTIFNGADDDASGTTAVIALARHFKATGNHERTLVFAAFTAEELGGFGSDHFVSTIDPDAYVAGVNLEMIGKVSKFGPGHAFITGFDYSDFGEILQGASEGFHPDPYPRQRLFWRSDNAVMARKGIPAHTVSSAQIDIDDLYHHRDDEIETLNLDSMTQLINRVARAVVPIVTGEATPTRIKELP